MKVRIHASAPAPARALIGFVMACAQLSSASWCLAQEPDRPAPPLHSRVLHVFDFTESANPNSKPMHWVRFPDPSMPVYPDPTFPRFTTGGRDMDIGHDAPPSFHLESSGRNVAFRYLGMDTRVTPGKYVVTGWIRPDRLIYARAALSAYYLDFDYQPIPGTQRFSRLIGTQDAGDGAWQAVRIELPTAPPESQAIGLTCWVTQGDTWKYEEPPHRYIAYRDVHGGAWFDDITVFGLPVVELACEQPGNVVESPTPVGLRVTVADERTDGLTARLTVHDHTGAQVYQQKIDACRLDERIEPQQVELTGLAPGHYIAELEVFSLEKRMHRQRLAFAVLAPGPDGQQGSRRAGVTLERIYPQDIAGQRALLTALGAGLIKLPLWSRRDPTLNVQQQTDHVEALLDGLGGSRLSVVGVLESPPVTPGQMIDADSLTLIELLEKDPAAWKDSLRAVVAPYAGILRSWQIGADADTATANDPRLYEVLASVRRVMRSMTTAPDLTAVASAMVEADARLPAENLSVYLPPDVAPDYIGSQLQHCLDADGQKVWVTLPLPNLADYDSRAVLGQWAVRLVETAATSARALVVPQPWVIDDDTERAVVEPLPAFVVYHTVVQSIGDLTTVHRFSVDGQAQAIGFTDHRSSVLVLWDATAAPEGHDVTLQLGAADRATDIWGRPVPIRRETTGRHVVHLSPSPIFVSGIEPWLIALRAQLRMEPERVAFSYAPHEHTLHLTNPSNGPLTGSVRLLVPKGWDIEPRRASFALPAGAATHIDFSIRHPADESAGTKWVDAEVELSGSPGYRFRIPLSFELEMPDVDVWAYAVREGADVVIRQGITNRADASLSFRGFAAYPGRSRLYRSINQILPGQTLVTEYRIAHAATQSGQQVRLGLRQVNGPRMHSLDVAIP